MTFTDELDIIDVHLYVRFGDTESNGSRYAFFSSKFGLVKYRQTDRQKAMKQLDVVVSPPAFLWDPYLTLTNVIFDLDICGL